MIVYLYFKDKKNCEFFFLNVKCFLKNIWGYPYWKPHNFFLYYAGMHRQTFEKLNWLKGTYYTENPSIRFMFVTFQYYCIKLKRCQFKSDWKLIYDLFNVCLMIWPPSWNRIADSTHAPPVGNGIDEPHSYMCGHPFNRSHSNIIFAITLFDWIM
jgi:hypothetical protein